jgi:3alpha(or 20beta)-hydroxysteroid dehydrogenase
MARVGGKVAIVTGAAGGQGAADARRLGAEGAGVIVTDISEEAGQVVAEEIRAAGGRAVFVQHDVADPDNWQKVVDTAQAEFGGLHVLVNNAGTISRKGVANIPLEAWNRVMAVNLTGAMLGMQLCAPVIRDCGGGSIINVSSTAGLSAHYDAAYSASKWGLRGITKSAAVEFAPWLIRVNSIHPGFISGTSFSVQGAPGQAEAGRRSIPMERRGTPEECADLVLFLASDESTYITGSEISIDGGYNAGSTMWMRNQMREMIAREEAGENA